MYINNEKREVILSYLNKSFLKKILYIGRGLDKAEAIIDYINSDYSNQDKKYNALVRTLWRNDTRHIKDIIFRQGFRRIEAASGRQLFRSFL